MASPVRDEHGGLSNAIATAANALKIKLSNIWPLMNSESNDLSCGYGCIPPSWYTSLSMPAEVQIFILVCSMFPENFRIPVEDLVMYVMGLELFEGVHGTLKARHKLHSLIKFINDLKYRRKETGDQIRIAYEEFGPHDAYVKVLGGAHDLAKSIASNYPLLFHQAIIRKKWPESNLTLYENCYGLALVLKKINNNLVYFEFPKLAFLRLQYGDDLQFIPADFFEGMKDLRVLFLDIPSLPYSLNVLRNLRTLHVKLLEFKDLSWIGDLRNLEFLSISTFSLIDIPTELGHLEKLRVLNLRKANLAYIPPGVLSRMLKLEELYLPLSFIRWACQAKEHKEYDEWELEEQDNFDGEGRINASLSEIVSLSLNVLQITVPKASVLPKKSPIFKNIHLFKIRVPNSIEYSQFGENSMNELQLTGDARDIKDSGVSDLMRRTENLCLTRVSNLKNVMYQLEDGDFPVLKKLLISECDELEYVFNTMKKQILPIYHSFCKLINSLHLSMLSSLKEILHGGSSTFQWFENLSYVSIRFCHKLKYGFPLSIIKGWTQLKSIEILDCNEMLAIFYEDVEDSSSLVLGSTEKLDLHSLPKLIGIIINKENTFVHDASSPPLTTNEVSVDKNNDHFKTYCAFPSRSAGTWFRNLKRLKIAFCDGIRVLFLFEENHGTTEAFNSLEELELYGLRNLQHIWLQIPSRMTAFQNLQLLIVSNCHNSYLLTPEVAKLLNNLRKVCISRCKNMEKIIVKENETSVEGKIVFNQLKVLELQHMPNLRMFSSGIHEIELPMLDSMRFDQCNNMIYFSYGLLRTQVLKRIEVNGSLYPLTEDINVSIKREAIRNHKLFTFPDLKIAANDCGANDSVGEDCFGKIYKGWIDDMTFRPSKSGVGMPVAIQKLNLESGQGFEEFQSEMHLERLWHPNFVKLLGHCCDDKVSLFVYEFVQRGSLDNHLFNSDENLSWDVRLKIAVGVARGLHLLHNLQPKLIHGHIKPSNILLDGNYNAKISDFRLSRSVPSDEDSYVATSCIGTLGYAAPEFIVGGLLHVQSDVYSFGVLLLELITGLRVLDTKRPEGQQNLVNWLKPSLLQKKLLRNIVDLRIEGQYSMKSMSIVAQLSSACLEFEPANRPSMEQAVDALQQLYAKSAKQADPSLKTKT